MALVTVPFGQFAGTVVSEVASLGRKYEDLIAISSPAEQQRLRAEKAKVIQAMSSRVPYLESGETGYPVGGHPPPKTELDITDLPPVYEVQKVKAKHTYLPSGQVITEYIPVETVSPAAAAIAPRPTGGIATPVYGVFYAGPGEKLPPTIKPEDLYVSQTQVTPSAAPISAPREQFQMAVEGIQYNPFTGEYFKVEYPRPTPEEARLTTATAMAEQAYAQATLEQRAILHLQPLWTGKGLEYFFSHFPLGERKMPEEYVKESMAQSLITEPKEYYWTHATGALTGTVTGIYGISTLGGAAIGGVFGEIAMASPKFAQVAQAVSGAIGKKILYGSAFFMGARAAAQEISGYPRAKILGELTAYTVGAISATKGFEYGYKRGLPVSAGRFKIPTIKGEVTKYTGIYAKYGGEAYPIIGRAEGKWVVGMPEVDITDIHLAGGWRPPPTPLATRFLKENLGQIYSQAEVERILATREFVLGRKEFTSWEKYIQKDILPPEAFERPEVARSIISKWGEDWSEIIRQYYGSATGYAMMPPEALVERGIPIHDWDIALKKGLDIGEIATQDLLQRLRGAGEVVWTTADKPFLIQTPKAHGVDIHPEGMTIEGQPSPYPEGSWGIVYEQPPVEVGGKPSMRLTEFFVRKGIDSMLRLYPEGAHPAPHRIEKDITDFFVSAKWIETAEYGKVTSEYLKLQQIYGITSAQIAEAKLSIPMYVSQPPSAPSIPAFIPIPISQPVSVSQPSQPIYAPISKPIPPSVPIKISPPSRPSVSVPISKPSISISPAPSVSVSPSVSTSVSPSAGPSPSVSVSPSPSPSVSPSVSPSISPSISPSPSISVSPSISPSVSPPSPPSYISLPPKKIGDLRIKKPKRMLKIYPRGRVRRKRTVLPRAGLLSQSIEMTKSIRKGVWKYPEHPKPTKKVKKEFLRRLKRGWAGMEFPTQALYEKGKEVRFDIGEPSIKHIMPLKRKRRKKHG